MAKQKLRDSDTLLSDLLQQRQTLIKSKVCHEPAYFETDEAGLVFSDRENELAKLYILSIDQLNKAADGPSTPARNGNNRKTGSVYVGSSHENIASRLRAHNGEDNGIVRKGTKRGGSHMQKWKLCLILFLPSALTNKLSTKVMRDYLRTAHKIEGKVRRSLQVARLFNLRYWVPPEQRAFVNDIKADVQATPMQYDPCDFKSS